MTKMRNYDASAKCKKCGAADIKTHWRPWNKYRSITMGIGRGPDEEHMERRCDNCHFEWYETPLAHKEGSE